MNQRPRVTIRDVAREAGVSVTTVSDALSGGGRLSDLTRAKVAAVADDLGYIPNPSARHLRKGRTGTIGLYFPDRVIGLEYYMSVALGAAEGALRHDMALTLIPGWRDSRRVASFHVDGMIVADPVLVDPVLDELRRQRIPVVTCERDLSPGADHAGRVESDNGAAIRDLLEHLREQGARRTALIASDSTTAWGHDLRAAYGAWCRKRRVSPQIRDVPLVSYPDDVAQATELLLTGRRPPDAIISAIDGSAIGVLQAAERLGLRVPQDLLVASCVDGAELRQATPAVTAIDIQPKVMGQWAAELLAELLEGTQPQGTVRTLETRLVHRASTAG